VYDTEFNTHSTFCPQVISKLADRHAADPTVWGVEPVNEPWQFIPIEWIKKFYWETYHIVREKVNTLYT